MHLQSISISFNIILYTLWFCKHINSKEQWL
nr:MAG TPA: hypothetical protein [Inoviridae sp.]